MLFPPASFSGERFALPEVLNSLTKSFLECTTINLRSTPQHRVQLFQTTLRCGPFENVSSTFCVETSKRGDGLARLFPLEHWHRLSKHILGPYQFRCRGNNQDTLLPQRQLVIWPPKERPPTCSRRSRLVKFNNVSDSNDKVVVLLASAGPSVCGKMPDSAVPGKKRYLERLIDSQYPKEGLL
jgi:hypothetical protein